jgi:hypothetical protein
LIFWRFGPVAVSNFFDGSVQFRSEISRTVHTTGVCYSAIHPAVPDNSKESLPLTRLLQSRVNVGVSVEEMCVDVIFQRSMTHSKDAARAALTIMAARPIRPLRVLTHPAHLNLSTGADCSFYKSSKTRSLHIHLPRDFPKLCCEI